MTCEPYLRCETAAPDDPALLREYDGAYQWTHQWVRHEPDDSVQDELYAVRIRLEQSLSPESEAAARGALFAILEHLGENPCPGCDRKEAA